MKIVWKSSLYHTVLSLHSKQLNAFESVICYTLQVEEVKLNSLSLVSLSYQADLFN